MSIKGQHIDEDFEEDPLPNAGQAVKAVFELLSKKIAAGEKYACESLLSCTR